MKQDAIIVSDVHLGSNNCQVKLFDKFIDSINTNNLILNGDIFDSLDLRMLRRQHLNVISKIKELSKKINVVWINGNHEISSCKLSHVIGTKAVEQYSFISGNKKILVIHGHQFDSVIANHPFLAFLGDKIYKLLQMLDGSHEIAKFVKHSSKIYLRCRDNVKNGSLEYCRKLEHDIVCAGHTHNGVAGLIYFNSGCWTEIPASYLKVKDGHVKLEVVT
jgi:UDP-2,3-diacylglucosamine pyrophosphatase LpxH